MSLHRFKVNDIVKVKTREEILGTLDPSGKRDGCLFMKGMWNHCGQKWKVLKVVENVFDEHRFLMYEIAAPQYLLDGSICDGVTEGETDRCDRSCYYFWNEEWLAEPDHAGSTPDPAI
jgi:hypothetical protein